MIGQCLLGTDVAPAKCRALYTSGNTTCRNECPAPLFRRAEIETVTLGFETEDERRALAKLREAAAADGVTVGVGIVQMLTHMLVGGGEE